MTTVTTEEMQVGARLNEPRLPRIAQGVTWEAVAAGLVTGERLAAFIRAQ